MPINSELILFKKYPYFTKRGAVPIEIYKYLPTFIPNWFRNFNLNYKLFNNKTQFYEKVVFTIIILPIAGNNNA